MSKFEVETTAILEGFDYTVAKVYELTAFEGSIGIFIPMPLSM